MQNYCVVETRIGFVALVGSGGKLVRSTLPKASREEAITALGAGLTESAVEDECAFGSLPGMLRDYGEGKQVDFSNVPVDLSAFGKFHAAALSACQKIPYGQLITYADLARAAGVERACRAAGSAMAANRTPIIIPCHRVVASGGRIGGFSSGLEWKRSLLKLEGVDI
ncbi:MAG: MGMT family protein [Armatimonadota bacterium]|nr:MGMT family protein [bacterium]